MGTLAALRAAEEVAKALGLRWGRIEFDVVNGQVHSIDERQRRDRRDAGDTDDGTVQLRETP